MSDDEKTKFYGPYELFIEVYALNEAEGLEAEAKVSLGHGGLVTTEIINEAMESVLKTLPEGWKIATKREWWEKVSLKNFGCKTAFPGDPDKWDE